MYKGTAHINDASYDGSQSILSTDRDSATPSGINPTQVSFTRSSNVESKGPLKSSKELEGHDLTCCLFVPIKIGLIIALILYYIYVATTLNTSNVYQELSHSGSEHAYIYNWLSKFFDVYFLFELPPLIGLSCWAVRDNQEVRKYVRHSFMYILIMILCFNFGYIALLLYYELFKPQNGVYFLLSAFWYWYIFVVASRFSD